MGNPHDFKPAGLDIKDPGGDNEPTLLDPSTAMVVGEAIGHNRNRTGVYGHSERSVGVYGKSPVWAGFFEGDVEIDGQLSVDAGVKIEGDTNLGGKLIVAGKIESKDFDSLGAKFFQLRDAFAQLEAGIAKARATFRGEPIDAPLNRPTLIINSAVVTNGGGGSAHVEGSGYNHGAPVWVFVFNNTKKKRLTVTNGANKIEDLGIPPFLVAGPSRDLNFDVHFQDVSVGDELVFSVTDGTADLNDLTQLLWSNQVKRIAG